MVVLERTERDLYRTLLYGGYENFQLRNSKPVQMMNIDIHVIIRLHAKIDQMITAIEEGVTSFNRKKKEDQPLAEMDQNLIQTMKDIQVQLQRECERREISPQDDDDGYSANPVLVFC